MKFKDIKGQRFGRLLVVERTNSYIQRNGKVCVQWLCVCDCSNTVVTMGQSLRNGNTKSCGCYNIDVLKSNFFTNISGEAFGMLKVLERTEDYISPKGKRVTQYKCECQCESKTIIIVTPTQFRNGSVKSCGCLKESFIASQLKAYCVKMYQGVTEFSAFKNPKTNRWLKYDIYIPRFYLFIEIQGRQHYIITNWHVHSAKRKATTPDLEFEYQREKDKLKRKYAKNNGYYMEIDLRKTKSINSAIQKLEKFISKKFRE